MNIIVDDADIPLLRSRAWKDNGSGYFKATFKGRRVYLHRAIAGAAVGEMVDHINGNPFDNRRSNLRICGRVGSNMNRSKRSDMNVPFKGITRTKSGKWLAQIMARKVHHRIGLFETPELAAVAYDVAAKRLHGDFARTNF